MSLLHSGQTLAKLPSGLAPRFAGLAVPLVTPGIPVTARKYWDFLSTCNIHSSLIRSLSLSSPDNPYPHQCRHQQTEVRKKRAEATASPPVRSQDQVSFLRPRALHRSLDLALPGPSTRSQALGPTLRPSPSLSFHTRSPPKRGGAGRVSFESP